mgnify:FL=1
MNLCFDTENNIECKKCLNNLLHIKNIEVENNKNGIDSVVINIICITCNEQVHSLKLNNNNGINVSWLREQDAYVKAIKNLFNT